MQIIVKFFIFTGLCFTTILNVIINIIIFIIDIINIYNPIKKNQNINWDIVDFLNYIKDIFISLVNQYGILGIFIIGFTEPIFQPFPTEIFMVIGIGMGLDWKLVLLSGALGSILGSVITYYLSVKYGEKLALRLFKKEDYYKAEEFLKRYGVIGFIVASFTPIPFEVICWVCGIFEMPFDRYILAVFISRLIKHGVVIIGMIYGYHGVMEIIKYMGL